MCINLLLNPPTVFSKEEFFVNKKSSLDIISGS